MQIAAWLHCQVQSATEVYAESVCDVLRLCCTDFGAGAFVIETLSVCLSVCLSQNGVCQRRAGGF